MRRLCRMCRTGSMFLHSMHNSRHRRTEDLAHRRTLAAVRLRRGKTRGYVTDRRGRGRRAAARSLFIVREIQALDTPTSPLGAYMRACMSGSTGFALVGSRMTVSCAALPAACMCRQGPAQHVLSMCDACDEHCSLLPSSLERPWQFVRPHISTVSS